MNAETVYSNLKFGKYCIPLVTVKGAKPGPTLVVTALQHPTEFSGPAAIDRVLTELKPTSLSGTLVALPIINPIQMHYSAARFRNCWKKPETNLNRQWPGDPVSKNPLSRLAALVWEQFIKSADAVIDYHCCRSVDPRFNACLDGHKPSLELAVAMGLEAVDLQTPASYADGPLIFPAAKTLGIPAVLLESFPGGFQIREAVDLCSRALWLAMLHLQMIKKSHIPGKKGLANSIPLFRRSDPSHSLKTTQAGYLGIRKWAGDKVEKGEIIAEIRSFETFEVVETIESPVIGAVGSSGIGTEVAFAKPGDVVATVKKVKWA